MKKIILGIAAVFALVSFSARAEEAAAGGDKPAAEKPAKKGKKGGKKEKAEGGDAPAGDAKK